MVPESLSEDDDGVCESKTDVPLDHLPGQWDALLRGGQVLSALILSTTFSEKYRGRSMYPGGKNSTAEVRLPVADGGSRITRHTLLHRAGNKEAVSFIWLGDEEAKDRTIYVAFSPMRHRSQFCKIACAPMILDVPDEGFEGVRQTSARSLSFGKDRPVPRQPLGPDGKQQLPISSYVHVKLKRMWGEQGLWRNLMQCVATYKAHRIIFSGISHGAALAQAAALQFRMRMAAAEVFAVTWNAYRWTDPTGSELARTELGERLLPIVLSRRTEGPKATRYWDTITGFPSGYAAMQSPILLDADTGQFLQHNAPQKTSSFYAVALMRAFELHFAKSAIAATKNATITAVGGDDDCGEEDDSLGRPLAGALQEKVLLTSEQLAQAQLKAKRQIRERISSTSADIRDTVRREVRKGRDRRRERLNRLAWCCGG